MPNGGILQEGPLEVIKLRLEETLAGESVAMQVITVNAAQAYGVKEHLLKVASEMGLPVDTVKGPDIHIGMSVFRFMLIGGPVPDTEGWYDAMMLELIPIDIERLVITADPREGMVLARTLTSVADLFGPEGESAP